MNAMQPDDLYGLPLERFIPERTALARELRAARQRDEAAAVAALRKPSVAAWAVNQLVRTQGAAVEELYDAGDALRAAQSALLSGSGDGRALRAANERERAAVDALVEAARGLLDSDGHELSATVVERVGDTLHAAALDEDARAQVRAGRLEKELRHVGLGLGEAVFAAAPAAPATKPKPKPKPGAEPAETETETETETKAQHAAREKAVREQAAAAAREREQARKAARAAESAARRRAERSVHALRAAEERRARAAQALADADAAVEAARAEAQEAEEAQRRAQAQLDELR